MKEIEFSINKNQVETTVLRTFQPNDTNYCIGPLVHIEEKTGIIYITAHILSDIVKDKIKIPSKISVSENSITIDIVIASKVRENTILGRSHWEFILIPEKPLDTLSLHEIYVDINFNEEASDDVDDIESISAIDRLTQVKNFVDTIQLTNIGEQQAALLLHEIKKIIYDGTPRRGTRFIPPK